MKKLFFIISAMLLLSFKYVNAEEIKSFTVISSSEEGYTLSISIMNATTCNLNDISYVGQPLKNYIFKNKSISYNGVYLTGELKWENPEYLIQNGSQYVTLLFISDNNNKVITFKVYINGLNESNKKVYGGDTSDVIYQGYINCDLGDVLPSMFFRDDKGKQVKGKVTYSEIDITKVGVYDIQWTFTPDDISYETKTGVIKVNLSENVIDQPISTTLTASSILLEEGTTYDINLLDKEEGNTYQWSTSNSKVAKVNNRNGLVSSVAEGEAKITCKVTNGNDVKVLSANVIVGDDDNAPILSETELDLSVGDSIDLDVENRIAKCKYLWKSSDKTIVKVNSATGTIEAVNNGQATITCTIITQKKEVIVLKCDVSVD
jgi:uncharacterized protein YjdB